MKENILQREEARERTTTLLYECEHESKDVSWCLFEPPVVARQRKHVEEINLMAGTFLAFFHDRS
jgi:hypothetical protein